MPEGVGGVAPNLCDEEARRQVAEVRHELRNYQAVNDIKAENLKSDFDRTAKEVKEETKRVAQTVKEETQRIATVVKEDAAASAKTIKTDFEVKHGELARSLSKIESLLKWAGSLIISLILGVLGWSLLQQITNNAQQQKDLQAQIKLLEQQERARVLQQPEQRVLPPSAAETALAAERAR